MIALRFFGKTDLSLLNEFAEKWKLKIEGKEWKRISGSYGYIAEYDSRLWCWTHSHTPDYGHKFFPIGDGWDEVKAVYFIVGPEGADAK